MSKCDTCAHVYLRASACVFMSLAILHCSAAQKGVFDGPPGGHMLDDRHRGWELGTAAAPALHTRHGHDEIDGDENRDLRGVAATHRAGLDPRCRRDCELPPHLLVDIMLWLPPE